MTMPRKSTPTTHAPEKAFFGYSESGAAFRSATPVENAVTGFVHDACRQIRDQFLSPADVEMLLRIKPAFVRSAFPCSHEWSSYHHHADWFAAPTSTSAEETLKRCMPQYTDDWNAYRDWAERGERHTHRPCRFDGLSDKAIKIFGAELQPPELHAPCRVHDTAMPRSSDSR